MSVDSLIKMEMRLAEGRGGAPARMLLFVGVLVWQLAVTTSVWAQAAIPIASHERLAQYDQLVWTGARAAHCRGDAA